jgi:hypothetical protein
MLGNEVGSEESVREFGGHSCAQCVFSAQYLNLYVEELVTSNSSEKVVVALLGHIFLL